MEKLLQEIFTGNPSYCEKKALELLKRGYKVIKKTFWADGKVSYIMQKVRVY